LRRYGGFACLAMRGEEKRAGDSQDKGGCRDKLRCAGP
jgi:hypothetical protein